MLKGKGIHGGYETPRSPTINTICVLTRGFGNTSRAKHLQKRHVLLIGGGNLKVQIIQLDEGRDTVWMCSFLASAAGETQLTLSNSIRFNSPQRSSIYDWEDTYAQSACCPLIILSKSCFGGCTEEGTARARCATHSAPTPVKSIAVRDGTASIACALVGGGPLSVAE